MIVWASSIGGFIAGIWLFIIAIKMTRAVLVVGKKSGSRNQKIRSAKIGAGVGTGAGVLTWLVVGGVGLATGGTAFAIGLPAMALLGLGAGALGGAATAKTGQGATVPAFGLIDRVVVFSISVALMLLSGLQLLGSVPAAFY